MRKYFVDTNYLLRYFLNEDAKQAQIVHDLFLKATEKKIKLFTSVLVFFEIYWVLSSSYNKTKEECMEILTKLLRINTIAIQEKDLLSPSLKRFSTTPIELEDCYNIEYFTRHNGNNFATFDKKLLKHLSS